MLLIPLIVVNFDESISQKCSLSNFFLIGTLMEKSIDLIPNLGILKRISEYCSEGKKVIVITDKEECVEFYKILRHFELSIYYTRRGWAIFLTNFSGNKFTKIKDDRYRFLKKIYPNCREYKELLKRRNNFFEDMLK